MRRRRFIAVLALTLLGPIGPGAATRGDDQAPAELLPNEAVQNAAPSDAATPRFETPPPLKPIGELTTAIEPPDGEMPEDVAAKHFADAEILYDPRDRRFGETMYFWQASNLAHRPLYFEQAYVERYGYNYRCLQPVVSGVEFYADVAALPFKRAANIRRPLVYDLGPARPGTRGSSQPRW
jgi:hypothetical protein